MAMLTRWDPFRELSTIQDRMNRLFQDAYAPSREEGLSNAAFAPPADVYEDENHITLKLEVPGIDEKDLDIRVENNTLIVRGERKFEKE
ncbi:MAG TPA: Hsp20/alpha crystallin family protein, partial [Terriglobales bacterium]|nr:Hsp20/alpha crystallin family protein [Terriglobales bacterium]